MQPVKYRMNSNMMPDVEMIEVFGLPTAIVVIIAAFYHIFDMGTTTNNCLGDLAGTVFV